MICQKALYWRKGRPFQSFRERVQPLAEIEIQSKVTPMNRAFVIRHVRSYGGDGQGLL